MTGLLARIWSLLIALFVAVFAVNLRLGASIRLLLVPEFIVDDAAEPGTDELPWNMSLPTFTILLELPADIADVGSLDG
jgi:hypothetical protein